MPKSNKTQTDSGLADLNDRIENTEALQDAAEGGKTGRVRNVRGKEQKVTQTTIFDEIDRFNAVSGKIASGSVVDNSIRDALDTIQIVAQRLDEEDITPQERKGLSAYLDVADKQIATADSSNLSKDDKKLYEGKVKEVKSEITNFRDLAEQGKRSYDGTKTFVENAKDDAIGLLIAGLTRNPALMIAHNLYAGYRDTKKKNQKAADSHHKASLRDKKKTLQEQKDALGEGSKIVDDANVDMGDMPNIPSQESFNMEEIIEEFRNAFLGELGNIDDLVSPQTETILAETETLISLNEQMASSLANIEKELAIGNELTKIKMRVDAENFAEMSRGGAAGSKGNKKSQLKQRKVEDESLIDDLSDLAETAAIVGTGVGMMRERSRKRKEAGKGGKMKKAFAGIAKGAGKLKGLAGLGGVAMFLASFGGMLLETVTNAFAPLMGMFKKIGSVMLNFFGYFKKIFATIGRFIRPLMNLGKVLFTLGKMVAGPITLIFSAIAGLMNVFEHWGDTDGQDLIDRIFSSVADFFGGIVDMFTGIFVDDPEAFRKQIVDSIMGLFTKISDWWDNLDIIGAMNDWFANSWLGKKMGMEARDPEVLAREKEQKQNARMRKDGVDAIVDSSDAFYEKWIGDDIQINDNADLTKTHTNTLKDLYTDDRLTDEASSAIKAELDSRGVSTDKVEMKAENIKIEMSAPAIAAIVDDSKDYSNEVIRSEANDQMNESIPNVNDDYDIYSPVQPNPDYVAGSMQPIRSMELAKLEELNKTLIMKQQQEAANETGSAPTVINNTTNNSQGVINQENVMPETSPMGDSVRNYGRRAL